MPLRMKGGPIEVQACLAFVAYAFVVAVCVNGVLVFWPDPSGRLSVGVFVEYVLFVISVIGCAIEIAFIVPFVVGLLQGILWMTKYRKLPKPEGKREGTSGEKFSGHPFRLFFIGDSIMSGVGSKEGLQAACADHLAHLLGTRVEWRTIAQSGACTRILARMYEDDRLAGDVGSRCFDAVVVSNGNNDAKKVLTGRLPSVFRKDTSEFCDFLLQDSRSVYLVVSENIKSAPVFQKWPLQYVIKGHSLYELQKQRLAEESDRSIHCFTMLQRDFERTDARASVWSGDGVHPSAEGYRILGECLAAKLAKSPALKAMGSQTAALGGQTGTLGDTQDATVFDCSLKRATDSCSTQPPLLPGEVEHSPRSSSIGLA